VTFVVILVHCCVQISVMCLLPIRTAVEIIAAIVGLVGICLVASWRLICMKHSICHTRPVMKFHGILLMLYRALDDVVNCLMTDYRNSHKTNKWNEFAWHLESDRISFSFSFSVPKMLILDGFGHFRFRPKMILRFRFRFHFRWKRRTKTPKFTKPTFKQRSVQSGR